MTAGRTRFARWTRLYANGYDISGDARSVGPLTTDFDVQDMAAYQDIMREGLPGHPTIDIGTINANLNTTATTGLHNILATAGSQRTVMVAIGGGAEPAQGDPCFVGQFEQKGYITASDLYFNIPFGGWSASATTLSYGKAWGWLLHANSAATAPTTNTAIGIDDNGGSSSAGGFMVYMVTAGNGTATITIEEASTNSNLNFGLLTDATTGELNCAVKQYGIVALSKTADVKQFLRWQIAYNSATTVTFILGFVRG